LPSFTPEEKGFSVEPGAGYGFGISTKIIRHNYPEIRFSHEGGKISDNQGNSAEYGFSSLDLLPLNYKLKVPVFNIRCKEKIIGYLNLGGGYRINFDPSAKITGFDNMKSKSGFEFNAAIGFYKYNNQSPTEFHTEFFYTMFPGNSISLKKGDITTGFVETAIGVKIMFLLHTRFKYADM